MPFILRYDAVSVNAYDVNDYTWLVVIHVVSIEQFFFRVINQGSEQDVHTSEAAKYSIAISE